MSRLVELDPLLVRPLKRPERRPKKPAPPSVHIRPAVLRSALAIVVAGLAISCAERIATVAGAPVLATYRTGGEIRSLERVIAEEQRRNDQLRADIAYLRTPAGVEQEARRRGWVRPGEVALSIPAPEGAGAPDAAVAGAQPERTAPVSERIREWIETCLAVLGTRKKTE